MKLQLEIATEGQDITIKGAAVLPFDKEAWKRRIGTWSYRILIASLLGWPTQCDGGIQPPAKCQSANGCIVTVGHQTISSGLVTDQSRGESPAADGLVARDF